MRSLRRGIAGGWWGGVVQFDHGKAVVTRRRRTNDQRYHQACLVVSVSSPETDVLSDTFISPLGVLVRRAAGWETGTDAAGSIYRVDDESGRKTSNRM